MEKFSNEYFRKLANDLKFDLSNEEIEELKKDFVEVEKQVELFETIDTEGVEPMVYPFEAPTAFLREDVVADVLDQKEALENAPDVRMGHVHVPKVVK
ncbi:Asp-tRNA(Asn)/Glu-tRNA(Gln) amidotransferase subunit GatC [Allobaculum sp. JKK-2023]|uniref:Asp-tRNA(Asn)/Glu-tRNA(Gln) amidotransferase subunit GatC n=1 Tax=Allobaculum sp. JKK-2023 TaxID=3108943 RepID=UPI002B055E83|nr:Asp-tRNA(Asn)/Glu-tRNA(Gln) amidotransferase subunit GatC [Allobaculum sp. JKK-2023]